MSLAMIFFKIFDELSTNKDNLIKYLQLIDFFIYALID